jgi:3-hydroxybutyryl-CoA dehydratase
MIRGYFEDNEVGNRIETRARTVTEADIVGFAGLSGDWHPLHTDAAYAGRGPFGQRIAHGMLVLAILTGLAPLDTETVMAFYGIDRLRFLRPTFIGDTIHVVSVVKEAQPRDETSGVIASDVSVLDDQDQVLVSGVFRMLVRRRTAENGRPTPDGVASTPVNA